jgi:hypothetical protein
MLKHNHALCSAGKRTAAHFANEDDVPSHETGEELTENDLQASDCYIVESV